MTGTTGEPGEEALLAFDVTGGDAGRIDAIDGAEVAVVGTPVRDLGVEELLKGGRHPRSGVNAVGDGVDLVLREHVLGDLAVLHGYAVDVAGEAEGEIGHIEQVVVETARSLDGGAAISGRGPGSSGRGRTGRALRGLECGW